MDDFYRAKIVKIFDRNPNFEISISSFDYYMEKWKTIESEYLHRRPWLTVRKDRVKLPDGREHDEYYVLEYPSWINVLAITKDRRYVMVRQYRHGLGDVFTELVAGVVEPNENPLDAAKRELLEETGYGNGQWRLNMVVSANPGCMNNLTYSYIAEDVELVGEQHLDETEDIEVTLVDEAMLRRMLDSDEIKQSLMAAPLWKYFYNKDIKR